MIKRTKIVLSLLLIGVMSGCSTPTKFYNELPVGKIQGQINLQWRDDPVKSFVYIPNPDNLFSYTTSDGEVITPGPLYTDGGSIPRIVSIDKHFVPWKHGPAYIIHDWLFELHDCGHNKDNKYDHVKAADIMAEVMKTQFVSKGQEPTFRERIAIWEIYGFTKKFSKRLWESDEAVCEIPPDMEIHMEMLEGVELPNVMGEDEPPVEKMDELLPKALQEASNQEAKEASKDVLKEASKQDWVDTNDNRSAEAISLSSHIKSEPIPYHEYVKKINQ